jgi:hypothetical protein
MYWSSESDGFSFFVVLAAVAEVENSRRAIAIAARCIGLRVIGICSSYPCREDGDGVCAENAGANDAVRPRDADANFGPGNAGVESHDGKLSVDKSRAPVGSERRSGAYDVRR